MSTLGGFLALAHEIFPMKDPSCAIKFISLADRRRLSTTVSSSPLSNSSTRDRAGISLAAGGGRRGAIIAAKIEICFSSRASSFLRAGGVKRSSTPRNKFRFSIIREEREGGVPSNEFRDQCASGARLLKVAVYGKRSREMRNLMVMNSCKSWKDKFLSIMFFFS